LKRVQQVRHLVQCRDSILKIGSPEPPAHVIVQVIEVCRDGTAAGQVEVGPQLADDHHGGPQLGVEETATSVTILITEQLFGPPDCHGTLKIVRLDVGQDD